MDDTAAAIAIVGIVLFTGVSGIVACVWLWAWRSRASGDHEEAYQQLAEEGAVAQKRTAFELGQIAEDLADLRTRMVELERMLKEVG